MRKLMMTILLFGIVLNGEVYGKTPEEETPVLVQTLAKQLVAKKRPRIAALDFTDMQKQPNELGRFLSEQLSVDMVTAEGITVVDRENISAIMAEHQLTVEGLVKPENAKKLGQFAGVDAIIIGNLAAMDNTFTLTVKAISTETSEVVAAGRCKFDQTADLMKQFSTAINGGAAVVVGGGNTVGNGTPSSQESNGIAKKKFENLEVVLKTVTPCTMQDNNGESFPVINCSFELYNRDLRNTVVIAANGAKDRRDDWNKISLVSYRGELSDSNGMRWRMPKGCLKGISSVLCFDCIQHNNSGTGVDQNNPSAVADYVKNGKKCEFGGAEDQKAIDAIGRFWAGSFSAIPPGKSTRLSVIFVPEGKAKIPQSFQVNMELVIGTVMNGEAPETSKDLRLENLVFDKVQLPK